MDVVDALPPDLVFCFLSGDRPCSAECAAFLTDRPEGSDYEGPMGCCSVLVSLHRTGKHLVLLAQNADKLSQTYVKDTADRKREASVR